MNILGIVAEYNPFHLGHLYHLQQAKKKINPFATICILGSNFLQRGEPSLIDKWARTEIALKSGIDLVLELPVAFSSRSALHYATGSIESLHSTGILTHLAFGAETGNLHLLQKIAKFLNNEDEIFKIHLDKYLTAGNSYPKARSLALKEVLTLNEEEILLLDNPNNILGLAYLRILDKLNSSIKPVIIKRKGTYHSTNPLEGFASATSIRKLIKEKNSAWKQYVPDFSRDIIESEFSKGKGPVFLEDFEQSIFSTIRRSNPSELRRIIEVNEGLENRIFQYAEETGSILNLTEKLKTKRYTYTKIQRLLTHIYLNYEKSLDFTEPLYLRVLGFTPKGQEILKMMKKSAKLPIITKFTKGYDELNKKGKEMLDLEIRASDLYSLAFSNPSMRKGRQDYYTSPKRCPNI